MQAKRLMKNAAQVIASDSHTYSTGGTEELGDRLLQQYHAVQYLMMILSTDNILPVTPTFIFTRQFDSAQTPGQF